MTEEHDLSPREFNQFYMSRNRPVVMKEMARDWPAAQKWTDFAYLKEHAGTSTSLPSVQGAAQVKEGERVNWLDQKKTRPHKQPMNLEKALTVIE